MAARWDEATNWFSTFLFLQLLQFMLSRGSLLMRRAGKRSMPI